MTRSDTASDAIINLGIRQTLKELGFKRKTSRYYLLETERFVKFVEITRAMPPVWNFGMDTAILNRDVEVYFKKILNPQVATLYPGRTRHDSHAEAGSHFAEIYWRRDEIEAYEKMLEEIGWRRRLPWTVMPEDPLARPQDMRFFKHDLDEAEQDQVAKEISDQWLEYSLPWLQQMEDPERMLLYLECLRRSGCFGIPGEVSLAALAHFVGREDLVQKHLDYLYDLGEVAFERVKKERTPPWYSLYTEPWSDERVSDFVEYRHTAAAEAHMLAKRLGLNSSPH